MTNTDQQPTDGPLHDVVVVDLTRVLAGPYATMVMADLGARVIKVEPPGGDDARQFGPFTDGKSAYFESLNRGKQSIALDLKSADERVVFEKLIARADVLVENYRAGALTRLGYDWQTLQRINQRLIYAAVSGFGQSGPYRDLPAYDLVVQAMGGLLSITGHPEQPPVRVGTSIGDITAGLFGLSGVLAALYRRERSGRGCMIDIAMLDCQVAILENAIGRHLADGAIPTPLGLCHPSITPFDGFAVGDELIIIAAGNDALFAKLCRAIDTDELIARENYRNNASRTTHRAALKVDIERALQCKSVDQWLAILRDAGVPCAPIHNIADVVADPQINARNMIIENNAAPAAKIAGNPIKLSDTADPKTRRAAPTLNADRAAVLEWVEHG